MRSHALRALVEHGHTVRAADIAGWEYRGTSLGLPAWVERLTWKTFKKVFYRDDERALVRGWNVRLRQDGLSVPAVPLGRRGAPVVFGHFVVVETRPGDGRAPRLELDYGGWAARSWSPLGRLRDPLVALEPEGADRLLGCSWIALGRRRWPTPSFFLLERDGPLSHVAPAPPTGARPSA
jgi:hypothetical protein